MAINNGQMILTGNTLLIGQQNGINGGPFTTVNTGLQVPGYPAGTTLNGQDNSANPNPVENSASTKFPYTVNPANPNGANSVSYSNSVKTQINTAKLTIRKSTDKFIAYQNDIIVYQLAISNEGNVPADNVVVTDILNQGLTYVSGSLSVSVASTGDPSSSITLINPIAPLETITITFMAKVTSNPTINPVENTASAAYTYSVDPLSPDSVSAVARSNSVSTTVFRNNFGQQISDLIESVALEQAALAAIANAEGAKIQRVVAMPDITPNQLLCLNKSLTEMIDSVALLETILKQKLGTVDCQITGEICH